MSIKIAMIGAGAAGFFRTPATDILSVPEFAEARFGFHGIDLRAFAEGNDHARLGGARRSGVAHLDKAHTMPGETTMRGKPNWTETAPHFRAWPEALARISHKAIWCWMGALFVSAACAGTVALAAETQSATEAKVFDIPRLDHIAIDGRGEDWGDKGFRVEALIARDGTLRPEADQDASFRLGWNDEGLLVLITLRDEIWVEAPQEDQLHQRDSVELFLGRPSPSQDICRWVIAPGMDDEHPDLRWNFHDSRKDARIKQLPAGLQAARTRTGKGCVIEALLPWSALDIKPKIGQEAAFKLSVNDSDDRLEGPLYQPSWAVFPDRTHRIRLAESPGEPVTAQAAGRYVLDRLQTRVGIVSTIGGTVTILDGGKPIASAPLAPDERRMRADIALPLPPAGSAYGPLTVALDGKAIGEIHLPDARWLESNKRKLAEGLPLVFRPCVFSQRKFPPVEFENPVLADGLIGPHAVKARFYDATFQEVTTAEKPGRYGAVVEVQPADGPPFLPACMTLFRTAEPANWSGLKVDGTLVLPPQLPQLSVKPEVAAREQSAIMQFLSRVATESSYWKYAEPAKLLAALSDAESGEPAVLRYSLKGADFRWWYQLAKKTGNRKPYNYVVHVPEAAKAEPGRRFPAILYLHGWGAMGDDIKVKTYGPLDSNNIPWHLAESRPDFPFIVITPQRPRYQWGSPYDAWQTETLKELVDEVVAKYPVDPDRLYMTGMSMGGDGCFSMAIDYPKLFAAVVPLCGGGVQHADAARIKDVPLWIFHGELDPIAPVRSSDDMFEALKRVGGRVRYSRFPGMPAHNDCIAPAYHNEDLYQWLLQQKRGEPRQPQATPGSTPDTSKAPTP